MLVSINVSCSLGGNYGYQTLSVTSYGLGILVSSQVIKCECVVGGGARR